MANKVKYKWTVLYLIKAVDITWTDAKNMIDGIVSHPQNRQVAIVFCLNIRWENLPHILPSYNLQDAEKPGRDTTVFLKIKSADEQSGRNQLELIKEMGEFDLRNPLHLEDYFTNQVLKEQAAERYLLFTWDHGMAYGIFKGEPTGEAFPVLTADQLAGAIQRAFGKRKIDVIIMMNCYMQFFDTCLALSAVANYLVAAETLFYDMTPFRYSMIFRALLSNPGILPAQLCEQAVDSVENMYGGRTTSNTQLGVAVFASSLKYYPAIAKHIDQLSHALVSSLKNDFSIIRDCREKCGQIPSAPAALVDFWNFIRFVQTSLPPGWQTGTLESLSALLQKAIIRKYVDRVYSSETDCNWPIHPSCFSVCFPTRFPDTEAAEDFYSTYILADAKHATLFAMRYGWSDFIASYLCVNAAVKTG